MITRTALEEAGYILPPRTPMIMNAAMATTPAVANTDQRTGIARISRAEAAMHRAAMNTDVVVVPLGISSSRPATRFGRWISRQNSAGNRIRSRANAHVR